MTYHPPELNEIGLAEDVIQGVAGQGSDMADEYPPALTLVDFED